MKESKIYTAEDFEGSGTKFEQIKVRTGAAPEIVEEEK